MFQQNNEEISLFRLLPQGIDVNTFLSQYMDHDPRGVMLVGPRRMVLVMNPAARTLLHYDDALPRGVGAVVHDTNLEFAVGDVFHDRRPLSYEGYVPDRLLRFHLAPILTKTGEPKVIAITIEDVTRLRYLETIRRDFVANVSHELRTPLASINLLVETLQDGAIDDPDVADHFLHRIQVEALAMAGLVEELLELSRLESGVLSLEVRPVDALGLLQSVVNRLAPLAEEKGIELLLDVQPDLPPVTADPARLEQIVMNLVHNGIKFTPQGTVRVAAARRGRGVEVSITDTGIGMDATDMNRIFERFYKADKGRSREGRGGDTGAGLGLAIARHLIEMHGGALRVVSERDRGSRFYFELPLATS